MDDLCLPVCANKFLFSPLFSSLSLLFSHERLLTHTHTHTDTHTYTYEYMVLVMSHLVLSLLELTSITTVIIGMTLYGPMLLYNIISYLMFFNLISSADLFSILFYSILIYSTLFQIDLI